MPVQKPQPSGVGRRPAICVVARVVKYPCGYALARKPRIWPGSKIVSCGGRNRLEDSCGGANGACGFDSSS
jgi:hypothetical protein